jgi:inward rectifier potassium channel
VIKLDNTNAKSEVNSGFGTNANSYGGRFINKDGSANIERRGLKFLESISWYHTLIDMNLWKFMTVLLSFFVVINLIFATIYDLIGLQYLNGIDVGGTTIKNFFKAFFFSAQTFTTVGYGHISPNGFLTSSVAAIEALVGLLSFSVATGLFFGRFSKPKAYLRFSKNALISPYKNGIALMMRVTPYKNTNFTYADAIATLGLRLMENGVRTNKFFQLELEMARVNTLSLSWTLVHHITENSPLFGFQKEDLLQTDGEIIVFIKTFDDMYSTTVGTKTSYTFNEIMYGAKFELMYAENESKTKTILQLDKLDSFYEVEMPKITSQEI